MIFSNQLSFHANLHSVANGCRLRGVGFVHQFAGRPRTIGQFRQPIRKLFGSVVQVLGYFTEGLLEWLGHGAKDLVDYLAHILAGFAQKLAEIFSPDLALNKVGDHGG